VPRQYAHAHARVSFLRPPREFMITESPLKCSINNGHKSRSWMKFSIHNGRAARKLCAVSDSGDGACIHRSFGVVVVVVGRCDATSHMAFQNGRVYVYDITCAGTVRVYVYKRPRRMCVRRRARFLLRRPRWRVLATLKVSSLRTRWCYYLLNDRWTDIVTFNDDDKGYVLLAIKVTHQLS